MSIRDYKITDAQIAEKGVIASPDTLTGTADENKRVFDRLVRECVAPQFNEIVETFADMEDSTTEWRGEEAKRQQAEQGRVSAETARVTAEDDRAQAESARVSAETARQHAESARDTAETARANAENKRDTADKSRVSAETGRVNAESARVTAESQRANAESSRAQNESVRISAETGRADAEADRVSAEDTRIANETARKNAETDRASAETARESGEAARKSAEKSRESAEQQRESSESTRQTAEQSRAGAETARANAEKARADAETARVSAEQARATAESKRAAAETVRQNAETGRTDAETARATAETKRVSAETARANAESTRQTNETARVSAEKSRAAAETARQTAEKARNVWEEYSAGKAYVLGNKVSFNGSSYLCTAETTGHAPTDTAYWLLIAKKGEDGKGAGDMLASVYDPKGKAQDVFQYADAKAGAAQSAAATYTDNKIKAIPTPDVSGQIETHNTSENAHADKFAKYLPLAGGKITGAITGGDSENWVYKSYDVTDSAGIRVAAGMQARERNVALLCRTSDGESTIGIGENAAFIQSGVGGQGTSRIMVTPIGVTINNVVTPATDTMPTPKSYVDKLKTKAHKVSLTVAGWDSSTKQQTVAVADVVADETAQLILPMPAAASMTAYNDEGIQCTAQAAGKLTFTADTVPTTSIDVYVTVTPVAFS